MTWAFESQKILEQAVVSLIRKYSQGTGRLKKVYLAGGVAMNCKMNCKMDCKMDGAIWKELGIERLRD